MTLSQLHMALAAAWQRSWANKSGVSIESANAQIAMDASARETMHAEVYRLLMDLVGDIQIPK